MGTKERGSSGSVRFQTDPLPKKRLPGNKEKGSWLERTTFLSIECVARAGALSSLLVALFRPLGLLLFHHRELDFPLHVVNAVNDDANFVADGVGLL